MQMKDTHAHRNNYAKLIRTAPGMGAGPGLTQGKERHFRGPGFTILILIPLFGSPVFGSPVSGLNLRAMHKRMIFRLFTFYLLKRTGETAVCTD